MIIMELPLSAFDIMALLLESFFLIWFNIFFFRSLPVNECVFGCFVDFVTFLCFALPGSVCVLVRLWAITLRRSVLRKSGYVSSVYAYD